MAHSNLTLSVQHYLDMVKSKLASIPTREGPLLTTGGAHTLGLTSGTLVAQVTVVDTDTDVAAVQALPSKLAFVDSRGPVLWTHDGSQWQSREYYGEEAWLRPMTLCYSPYSGKLYYCNTYLQFTEINLTTDVTVQ